MMKSKIEEMTSTNPYDGAIRTKDGHRIGIGDYIKIPLKDLIAALPLKAELFRDVQDKDGNVLFLVNNISADFEYFLLANDHESTHLEEYISVALVERCGEYVGRMVSEAKNDCGEVVSRVITKEDIAGLNDKIKVANETYLGMASSTAKDWGKQVTGLADKMAMRKLGRIINNCTSVTEQMQDDKVSHPSHYTWLKDLCGIEVIDIARHLDFCTGNALKYLLRAGKKSEEGYTDKEKEIQDLRKAVWYLEDKIKMLETDERD